jgi:hypothetical protein
MTIRRPPERTVVRSEHESFFKVEEYYVPNSLHPGARPGDNWQLFQETYRALEPIYEQLGKKQGA